MSGSEIAAAAAAAEANSFKQFDAVSDHSDHSYRASKDNNLFKNSSAVHKKIMREWRILEASLPDSIYVRVYDTRIDLLRAAIVGAPGTPYHDALFFFDVRFPPDYPTRPPSVHYHSHGLRVNPNLYASGYVCLSLLNTWAGNKSQKWDPTRSTVLQVLLSIQALVLNEKPYFNEPGTGSSSSSSGRSEKRSRAYSEDAFLLTCRSSLYILRKPPRNFEALVAEHFRRRGGLILRACSAYVNKRVGVGYYKEPCPYYRRCCDYAVSAKFTAAFVELYPRMVDAFRRSGACLDNVEERLVVVRQNTTSSKVAKGTKKGKSKSEEVKEGKSGGIAKKVLSVMKKLLGLKKDKDI